VELLFQLAFFLVLLGIGLFFGRAAEKRHFRELVAREAALRDILVFSERTPPPDRQFAQSRLVVGSAVIAEDYFKRIASGLRSFFGGRLSEYESLMDRGRREAIVRMKEEARRHGATLVFNVRVETSSLSADGAGSPMFSAEFLAYGTGLKPAD
jgi:uncharacterized protein YbjQ (UPF0145 family)